MRLALSSIAQQPGVVHPQVLGVYEVFGEFGVEREEVADQVGEGAGERGVGAGCLAQDARGELVAGRVGEQARGGFEPDAQSVVGEQAAREGVVGADDGLARRPAGSITSGSVTPALRAPCGPARRVRPPPCW